MDNEWDDDLIIESGFTNVILNDFKWWLRFDIVNAFCIICSAVLWEYYEEFYFLYLYNVY